MTIGPQCSMTPITEVLATISRKKDPHVVISLDVRPRAIRPRRGRGFGKTRVWGVSVRPRQGPHRRLVLITDLTYRAIVQKRNCAAPSTKKNSTPLAVSSTAKGRLLIVEATDAEWRQDARPAD